MSKIPFTIEIDETICANLDEMRSMCKTGDYSSLPANIERIQSHANKMESALWVYHSLTWVLKERVDDEVCTDEEFREKCRESMKEIKDAKVP